MTCVPTTCQGSVRAYLGPEDTDSHLPGAVNIPVEQLAERLDELPADTEA